MATVSATGIPFIESVDDDPGEGVSVPFTPQWLNVSLNHAARLTLKGIVRGMIDEGDIGAGCPAAEKRALEALLARVAAGTPE